MVSSSVVVEKEETARLLNRLLKDCGREHLRAVLPGREKEKELLLVSSAAMLQYAEGFSKCLAEYSLHEDSRLVGKQLTTYSLKEEAADYTACGLHTTAEGFSAFEIVGVGCIGRVRLRSLPQGGEETILMAASAAVVCGAPFAQVLASLQQMF